MTVVLGDGVSLKHLRDKAKAVKKEMNCKNKGSMLKTEAEMEMLCQMKSRVDKRQQLLLQLPISKSGKSFGNNSGDMSIRIKGGSV